MKPRFIIDAAIFFTAAAGLVALLTIPTPAACHDGDAMDCGNPAGAPTIATTVANPFTR